MDYCCSNCGYQYDKQFQNTVQQCPNCWFNGHVITVIDSKSNCFSCNQQQSSKVVLECKHWICIDCYYQLNEDETESGEQHDIICGYCNLKTFPMTRIHSNQPVSCISKYADYYKKLYLLMTEGLVCVNIGNVFDQHIKRLNLILEYHKWLQIVSRYKIANVRPSYQIENVWKMHILDTTNYRSICELFNKGFIHHSPGHTLFDDNADILRRINNTKQYHIELFGSMDKQYWNYFEPQVRDKNYIYISQLTGRTDKLPFCPHWTTEYLKHEIHKIAGIPPCQQRVMFMNIQFDDNKMIQYYNVFGGCVLNLVLRLGGC